eukprot:7372814-Prymnesium_polylepis.1
MWARAYARSDLYCVLEAAAGGAKGAEEERFVRLTLAKFRNAGAAIASAHERAEFSRLDQRVMVLSSECEQNINEDNSCVCFSEAELAGCPADFIASLPLAEGGQRKCSVKAPVMTPIMQRASCGETRRRISEAAKRQCMESNGERLEELITTRHAAAAKLGFASHAERMLSLKMAATADRATQFCEDLASR